jgi:iron complex outermembrane recepter protein
MRYHLAHRMPTRQWKRRQGISVSVLHWVSPALLLLFGLVPLAKAQHAADNAVLSAEDAFGFTLGTESIGIYNPGGVRGFSPQVAGDVRIDGLYFDSQAPLSGRVVEQSLIRVGISEIGYLFPAPTGIVDYDLRHVTDTKPIATVIASGGPFESRSVSLDTSLPFASNTFALPIGGGYQVAATNPGYTSNVASFGLAPQWKPNEEIALRAFFDWENTSQAKTLPYIFTAGPFLPPEISRGYLGQNWAEGSTTGTNYGLLLHARLNEQLLLSAGLFRSIYDVPHSYADLYLNTLSTGLSDHEVVGFPEQRTASNSGEVRLTEHFVSGTWTHDLVSMVRGKDAIARYGGADTVDAGPAFIGQGIQITKPSFNYSALTDDRTQMWSAGLAYHGRWLQHLELSVGLQREEYNKAIAVPGYPQFRISDTPWRGYGTLAIELARPLTGYIGFSQGLEDSGIAPNTAANAGTILPAAQTWQLDGGFRYLIGSRVKLVTGVFELDKPYFNIDSSNLDQKLGSQKARGLEFSVAGEVVKNLNLVAGAVVGRVQIQGPDLAAEGVGSTAIGQPHVRAVVDANYSFQRWPALSSDVSAVYFGRAPATVDNALTEHATTTLDVGGRFKLSLVGAPATLRVQVQNVLNAREWNILFNPGFFQYPPPRSVVAMLTVDFS